MNDRAKNVRLEEIYMMDFIIDILVEIAVWADEIIDKLKKGRNNL